MKVVIALFQHETNTFSSLKTPLQAFATPAGFTDPPAGETAISAYGKADFAFAAMLDIARERNAEIEVPVVAYAEPSGLVLDTAFDEIAGRICAAIEKGCDAVLLDLHGAMVTESHDDGEGELLRRIRQCAPDIPIAVALDFHANVTETMVTNSTVIDGYRTYPHVDMYQTGERATATLFKILDGEVNTRQCFRTLPIMTHMLKQSPLDQPMKSIMENVIDACSEPELHNVALFGGFPLADIPHVALSMVITETRHTNTDSPSQGTQLLDQLSEQIWRKREAFTYKPQALSASIQHARQLQESPVVIVDLSDGCGAGGNTDDMTVLAEMLQQGCDQIVAGPLWDAAAVDYMISQGEGSEVELDIGGHTDTPSLGLTGKPLRCRGRVEKITDGRFTIQGPMQTGLVVQLGRTVVLNTGAAQLLICEERWEPYDPGCFTHAGIDPFAARYILIKSRQHFRATFETPAAHIVLADAPGVSNIPFAEENYQQLKRPIYPLDAWDKLVIADNPT
ncbi:MAG: M81 family metallopeptidase [Thiolinea sp.]